MAGGISQTRDIGESVSIRTVLGGIEPQVISSSAVSGTAIDRNTLNDPQSVVMHLMAGTVTGSPTSAVVSAQLQHAPDNGSGSAGTMANFGSPVTVTSGGSEVSDNIDLSGANRWIQVVATPALSGGTSPTVPVAADLVFGGGQELPAP